MSDFHKIIQESVFDYFKELSKYYGKACKKCGLTQGTPSNGFDYYFCEHITNEVSNKVKIDKKRLYIELEKELSK